jgi:hypothetical protein
MNSLCFNWKSRCYPAPAILAGLLAAQITATFQVYFSNRWLQRSLEMIHGAGYLTVPNEQTMGRLQEVTTALCGGLFFTFTLGAGISVLSFAAAWFWDRIGLRKPIFLVLIILVWAAIAVGINGKGFSFFSNFYFALIPPLVFVSTLKWMPQRPRSNAWIGILNLVPIVVLGFLWTPEMKNGLFINIRDQLLLANPLGERIVHFYYQYTLYPAEAVKPLNQKLLKTCNLDAIPPSPYRNELRKYLTAHDWIEVENHPNADLMLRISGNRVLLSQKNETVLKLPKNEFLSHAGTVLKQFSFLTDRHRFFRQFTFYSLLFGFPITLYIFLYSIFFFSVGRWTAPATGALLSSTLCFLTACLLIIPLWQNIEKPNQKKNPVNSPGLSRVHETVEQQLNLLKDPSPLRVCAALSALAREGGQNDIPQILQCLKKSDHWYVQWRAYKALKALGWKQEKMTTFEKDHDETF